jgi:hypothetical protein
MDDVLTIVRFSRLWPLALFGICFIVFAKHLSEIIQFRLSPKMIRLAGAFLLALALGLFLYAYVNTNLHFQQ